MKCLLALAFASTLVGTGCTPAYRMQPNVAELMVASAVAAPQAPAEAPAPGQTAAGGDESVYVK
jgi:hypothetical protein